MPKRKRLFNILIRVLAVGILVVSNGCVTQSASKGTPTTRLIRLSSGMKADDITEIKNLIANGADVNAANKDDGYTPIMNAAHGGHAKIVTALLKSGADVNAANKDGYTPIMVAVFKDYYEIVTALLKAGADINASNKNGATVLVIATQQGHAEIVSVLLEAGADTTTKFRFKGKEYTLFGIAQKYDHEDIVKILNDNTVQE